MLNHNQRHEPSVGNGEANSRILGMNAFASMRIGAEEVKVALNYVDSKGKGSEPQMALLHALSALNLLESLDAHKVSELRSDVERIRLLEERRATRIPEIEVVTKRYWELENIVRGLVSSLQKQRVVAEASAQLSAETARRARNPLWHALYLVGARVGVSGQLATLSRERSAGALRDSRELASTISALDRATEHHEKFKDEYEARGAERVYLDSSIRNCCKSKAELESYFQINGEAYRSSPLGAELRKRLNNQGSSSSGEWTECLQQIERELAALNIFSKRLGIAKHLANSGSPEANTVFEVALAAGIKSINPHTASLDFQVIGEESIWESRQRTLIRLLREQQVNTSTQLSASDEAVLSGGATPTKGNRLSSWAWAVDQFVGKEGEKREAFDREIERDYSVRAESLGTDKILSVMARIFTNNKDSLGDALQAWDSVKATALGLSKPDEDAMRARVMICLKDNLYAETEELTAFVTAMIHRNASPNQIKPDGHRVIELLGIAAIVAAEGAEISRHIHCIETQTLGEGSDESARMAIAMYCAGQERHRWEARR